jgi:PTH1 family peptidyl-tRNA hydrolase
MNESGRSLAKFKEYFKIDAKNIMVVCDDINLPHGNIRIRKTGGAGGHNGLKSIISLIGTKDFSRLRIGVGGGELQSTSGHVLGNFSTKEFKIIEEAIDDSARAIEEYTSYGLDSAMNKFNSSSKN